MASLAFNKNQYRQREKKNTKDINKVSFDNKILYPIN